VTGLRRREVALYLALGALRSDVVRALLRTAVRVVAAGCVCGLVLALGFTRSLATMLYGVTPSDPVTFLAVIAIVLGLAACAALVPAARAAFSQPMRTLRED
jgi:putative ABC transport system permease protein